MKTIFCYSLLVFTLFFSDTQAQNKIVSLKTLLTSMVDRDALARYPDPYYTTRQFSSFDRDSKKKGKDHWFANWDRSQFIRIEKNRGRTEYVMMDTDGPGAIVRFWMTFAGRDAGQGILRIYFDGEKEPTIKGKALDILSGGALAGMPLSMSEPIKTKYEMRGHSLYLPLPYSKHCKITYESKHPLNPGAKSGGESVYYNINYRAYTTDTQVRTFSYKQLKNNKRLIRLIREKLLFRDKKYQLAKTRLKTRSFSHTLAIGASWSYVINGPAAIRQLSLQLKAQNPEQALRSTVIKISFDGNRTVWVPVGDFFGTGYQYRKSNTWYTTVTKNGDMETFWVMPFHKQAQITFTNLGKQKVSIRNGSVSYSNWKWDPSSMYFGASWHQYTNLYTGKHGDHGRYFDINYTKLKGQGVYIGDVLTLFNTAYAWWGEGDEKIFVDGENFPSNFGTGSEDYYGYAWARPQPFTSHPFISQPDGSGNITPGYTVDIRLRSLDAIPFRKKLVFNMGLWHWASTVIDIAPTTFYYLKPGSQGLIPPDWVDAQKVVPLRRSDLISPVIKNNRIEAENMIIDSFSGGALTYQHLDKPKLSNGKQLWWWNGKVGDVLQTEFISKKSGMYNALSHFVVARDYGKVSVSINGQTVLQNFNAFNPTVSTRKVNLGRVKINKGDNVIRIKITGQSPIDKKAFLGLDYIEFIK